MSDETAGSLAYDIHGLIRNHTGHTINLAVEIMNFLKTQELLIHDGEIHGISQIDEQESCFGDGEIGYSVWVD